MPHNQIKSRHIITIVPPLEKKSKKKRNPTVHKTTQMSKTHVMLTNTLLWFTLLGISYVPINVHEHPTEVSPCVHDHVGKKL